MRWDGHFRLAHDLGIQLHELMDWPGPMTHRQYLAWQEWLQLQWNEPDRHDWYLMKIAAILSRSPFIGQMRIPFTIVKQSQGQSQGITREQIVEANRKERIDSLGASKVIVRRVSKDGTRILSEEVVTRERD